MSDDRQDIEIEVPVVAPNAGPSVMSDLMEVDDALAKDILYLVNGIEHYRNPKHISHKGFSLSLEDENSGGLSKLIDALIKFLIRMMDDLTEGTTAISLNLNRIVTRAEAINTSSRAERRVNKEPKFKIETRIPNLCVNFKPINDPQRILMYLKSVDVIIRKYFKYQEEDLLKVIPSIIQLDPAAPQHLDQLVAILNNVSPTAFANGSGFSNDGYRMVGSHLLGNQQLLVLSKNANSDPVEQLTGQEFILQPSDTEPKAPPDYLEFDVFARTIEQSILRQIIVTSTDLANRIGMLARMRRNGKVKDIVKYLEVIRTGVAQGKYEGEALQNATSFILLLEAFNNWLVNPYLNLLALSCRNMSAILNVCEANN